MTYSYYRDCIKASGISEALFLRYCKEIRVMIGTKPKHRPRYISDL